MLDWLIEKINPRGQIAAAIKIRHGPVVPLDHGYLLLAINARAVSQDQLVR
jgi:hypothetical protein